MHATSLKRVQEKSIVRGENLVGCLLLVVFLAFPRIVLALLFFFSSYQRAYHGLLFPVIGFLLIPLTTLVYAWMANTRQPIAGINLLILIVAVVIDLGGVGGGAYDIDWRRWQERHLATNRCFLGPTRFGCPTVGVRGDASPAARPICLYLA